MGARLRNTNPIFALSLLVFVVGASAVHAAMIASTNFDGRTLTMVEVANDTATNLGWSLNGVLDPGDMSAKNEAGAGQAIFNNTALVQNNFVPGINTGNGNTFWTTDVSITPNAGTNVTLTDVTFNYIAVNGSQNQNVDRKSDFTVTLFDPSDVEVDSVTVADVLGGTVAGQPLVTLTFAAPIALTSPGSYTLQIKGGDFTGDNETGNHTAIDNLSINGIVSAVPEPASLALLAIGVVGFVAARRNR